jgi:hypothetical protein
MMKRAEIERALEREREALAEWQQREQAAAYGSGEQFSAHVAVCLALGSISAYADVLEIPFEERDKLKGRAA